MGLALKLRLAAAALIEQPLSAGALVLFTVGIALFTALALGVGVDRTILVDARTRLVAIEFSGESNAWPIGGAIVCRQLPAPDPTAGRGDEPCDPRLFSEDTSPSGFVDWGPGGRAEVFLDSRDRLVIWARCSASHDRDTRIILEEDAWRTHGAFGWIGSVVLGERAGSGETGLLIDGSYEAREVMRWFLPDALRTTEVVKTGQVRSGEAVRLVTRDLEDGGTPEPGAGGGDARPPSAGGGTAACGPNRPTQDAALPAGYRPAVAYGHIVLETDSEPALRVVALTAPGNTALLVDFAGASRAALVRPNWIDRLTSSPLVTALATALAVAVALVNFAAGLGRVAESLRTTGEPEAPRGDPAAAPYQTAVAARAGTEDRDDDRQEGLPEVRPDKT